MNGKDPKHRKTFRIRPEQVWNVQGMIQQLVMLLIMLAVYTVARLLTQDPEGGYTGLISWLQQFHGLFRTPHLLSDLLTGALAGAALAGMFLLLDVAVGYIRDRAKLNEWIHRSDFMLPENRKQRKWALGIALSGSAIEEILFRGFIFWRS
ncbi:MAG: hypothetical protein U5N26_09860 [Candidatus Marinimicrobia bacterium]|nr:hypothetical protein [Candidatus Neomarinimicrobiota bacterium]